MNTQLKQTVRMKLMTRPECEIDGGNIFSIVSKVKKTLIHSGKRDQGNEFQRRALAASSYESVLEIAKKYVTVA